MLDRSKTERLCVSTGCLRGQHGGNRVERQDAPMRKLFLMLAAVTALAVAGPAGAATTKTVNIFGSAFSPKSVTITEGDTVTWVNRDNANHQILADKGQFVSLILRPKQSYSFQFNAAGTYTYKDELNTKLAGTIKVNGLPPTLTLAASSQYVVFGDK